MRYHVVGEFLQGGVYVGLWTTKLRAERSVLRLHGTRFRSLIIESEAGIKASPVIVMGTMVGDTQNPKRGTQRKLSL